MLRALPRKLRYVVRLAPLLLALCLPTAFAQPEPRHRVPAVYVRFSGEAITIDTGVASDTFIGGLGWLSGSSHPAPYRAGDELFVGPANLERLGLPPDPVAAVPAPGDFERRAEPGGANVRFGGDAEIRVVLDLPFPEASTLAGLHGQGRLDEGEALVLDLPRFPLPTEPPDPYHGIDVSLLETPLGVRFELRGPAASYRIFSLEGPTRLVVDVVPLRDKRIDPESRTLREGVTYHTFGASTPTGRSRVHLLEIAPGAGEFRVVGTTEVPRTLSELADGAFAAINAGYFDTGSFQAIGLLRVDYDLQSLPSRNRASIGFGSDGPVITRVSARIDVRVAGRVYRREAPTGDHGVQVHTVSGARIGSVSRGALVAQHGRIVANRVGPVTVPENGFVVVYPPDDRELALIDPGAPAAIDVDFEPDLFQSVRYAVEAGPLLVENGQPAFEPQREEFVRGQRILDVYTQQSAIGIRSDGTVLLLVADDMRAEDLVPLFLSLDAEQAMRLDSGSSAALLADGRIFNRVRERRIVSAIVFLPDDR